MAAAFRLVLLVLNHGMVSAKVKWCMGLRGCVWGLIIPTQNALTRTYAPNTRDYVHKPPTKRHNPLTTVTECG